MKKGGQQVPHATEDSEWEMDSITKRPTDLIIMTLAGPHGAHHRESTALGR
jgi:hypothetical protein